MDQAREVAVKALDKCIHYNTRDWNTLKSAVRDDLRRFIYDKTGRNPVILPIFMEV